ncbi:MAG TPA: hypothetical protein VGN43_14705 [Steroidobacteraceae bacterium]|jgi:hypothetical protein|nr:hypothetical protein [Steroidobacteraceae bacterium]
MSSRDQADEKLERLVGKVLREQPLRRAPASLEARVLSELAARARLPWWRRGIASWPATVRVPVIAGCAVCVPAVWVLSLWLAAHLLSVARARMAAPLAAIGGAGHTLASLGATAAHIFQSIPREWLVGGILATATLYAVLFALVAVGYSLLYPRTRYSKAHPT